MLAANEALRRAQAAREAAGKLLTKHLSTLDAESLLQVTAPVHARVLAGQPVTAAEQVRRSPIPDGATDGRVRRARGAVARRAARIARRADGPAAEGLLARLNRQELRTRPAVPTPSGMVVTTLTAPAPGTSGLEPGAPAAVSAPPLGARPCAPSMSSHHRPRPRRSCARSSWPAPPPAGRPGWPAGY